ncbi:50S ribosomal protein L9 [Spirochaetia bacterium]|nr:50S ribosomal protein L9 [Spirochaetia bacterium]
MKVILNKDLSPLGEEGDIKDVAKGYARNYLFPRGIALPYTDRTIKLFESRKEEIEARKAAKRQDAAGMKEKLEALEITIVMPAGTNGKLYGAVTSQTVAEELTKQGYPTERKRVELPGNSFKSVGKYKVAVKLYESAAAEITVTVEAQIIKTETKAPAPARKERRRHDGASAGATAASPEDAPVEGVAAATAQADASQGPAEAAAPEAEPVPPADGGTPEEAPNTEQN